MCYDITVQCNSGSTLNQIIPIQMDKIGEAIAQVISEHWTEYCTLFCGHEIISLTQNPDQL